MDILCPKASLEKSCIYSGRITIPDDLKGPEGSLIAIRAYHRPYQKTVKGKKVTTRKVRGYIFVILIDNEGVERYKPLAKIFIDDESRKKFLKLARSLSENLDGKLWRILRESCTRSLASLA